MLWRAQDKSIEEIKNTNHRLQKENNILWNKINLLTEGPAEGNNWKENNLEQYCRRKMIKISGIPHEHNEDYLNWRLAHHQVCKISIAAVI